MRALEVLIVFLRLGLTSFGGPVAHLGYFRTEFVERRRWLDEPSYAGIVGLCQFLPGPASSQVAMALGLMRAGLAGALAAFIGFTAPSALLMTGFAYLMASLGDVSNAPWIHGLKIAAVAVVAQAVWSMARSLAPDLPRAAIAAASAAIALLLPSAFGQIAALALGGAAGWLLLKHLAGTAQPPLALSVRRPLSRAALALFFVLLIGLPFAAALGHPLALFAAFYRAGALVFGGGHVVLPLLQQAVVVPGWIGKSTFLAGYGAAQAVPGPLFSFAAFLGAAMHGAPSGWQGALLCLLAIYLPSVLLVIGALPLWNAAQSHPAMRAALAGINASVVGLLFAALCTPVWTGAIFGWRDFAIALAALSLLVIPKAPSWLVVLFCALAATAVTALSR